jgi:predicted secreted protein
LADRAIAAAEETVVIGPRRRVIEGIALTAAGQQAAPSTDTAVAEPVHRTLRGTVRAGSGATPRRVAGVRIRLLDERGQVMQQTRSDAEGRYRFEQVAAGRYRVQAPAGKTAAATHVRTVTVEAGSGPIRVAALTVAGRDDGDGGSSREAAQAHASIRGSVRRPADDTQQAVAGVRVRLLDVRGQVVQQTHATVAGQYRFNGVAPGRYNVKVAGDPSGAGVSVRAIAVEPGKGVTRVQALTAERDPVDREKTADAGATAPSEGVIRGTVYVRHNGAHHQAGGVRVRLLDGRGQVVRQGESAGNGRYRFTGVPTGRYEVHVPDGAKAGATGADPHVERVRLTAGEAGVRGVDVVVAPGHVGQVGRRWSATGPDVPDARVADPGIPGNWLAGQGPGRYTIQLIGLPTQAAARAFIERHGLADRALYLRTRHDGELRFLVLYGSFDTRAAAQSARAAAR